MYNIFLIKKEKELVGKDVVLKKPKRENWKEWAELRQRSREFLQPWEPKWPNNFLTKDSFMSFISMVEKSLKNKTGYNFFIFNKKNNLLMGGVSLTNFKSEGYKSITIGYWMGKEYAGKGYMKDSLKIICDYCFTDLSINRIEAACLPKNLTSKKVLLNVGFKIEGYAKKYLNINGKLEDHLLFAKIKKGI
tara:strand:- start:2248 stop:2820 length:573 start_codon:yes stop_codon:yes gene_type:complete